MKISNIFKAKKVFGENPMKIQIEDLRQVCRLGKMRMVTGWRKKLARNVENTNCANHPRLRLIVLDTQIRFRSTRFQNPAGIGTKVALCGEAGFCSAWAFSTIHGRDRFLPPKR
jgi:hypothetical protein